MASNRLWLLLLLPVLTFESTPSNICIPNEEGNGLLPGTLCGTPYCTCNNPYGRVQCSCIPRNSTSPRAYEISIRASGPCSIPPETRDLIITDCNNSTFTQKGLDLARNLRSVQVTNVKEVVIERHAFHWNGSTAGIVVLITNTTIAHLPSFAFSGYVAKVVLRNVYLGLIKAFAFSSITNTERIHFIECNFANIEPQSFKKFATNDFQVEKSRFNIIPSRFLQEVHVHQLFRLDSNIMNIARTLSFHVNHPNTTLITQNHINVIEGEAFNVQARGPVTIRDNIFEIIEPAAFRGIKTDRIIPFSIPPNFLFENNTLGSFSQPSLHFNRDHFNVIISKIRFDDTCDCEKLAEWRDLLFPSKKKVPIEAHLSDIMCHLQSRKEIDFDFISSEVYHEENCTQLISSLHFFVIVIVSAVVGLCVLIVVAMLLLRKRRQWDAVPTTEINGVTPKPAHKDPKKGLVVPDGRVYRETEFHVVVEKVEPMEEAVPYIVTRDRSKTYIREAPS